MTRKRLHYLLLEKMVLSEDPEQWQSCTSHGGTYEMQGQPSYITTRFQEYLPKKYMCHDSGANKVLYFFLE